MSNEFTDKWQKVGAIWQREKGGFSGVIDADLVAGEKVMIWPNNKRPGKRDPDFCIYIARNEQPQEQPKVETPVGDGECPF